MAKAIIEDGIVTNAIEVDPDNPPDWAADLPDLPDGAGIGWRAELVEDVWQWHGPEPQDQPEPDREEMKLTFAQLMIGLVSEGWITEAEGDEWLDGTLPEAVTALIETLPEEQRFPARARAKRLIEATRLDPLVLMLAASEGKTEAEMDAFFEMWGAA